MKAGQETVSVEASLERQLGELTEVLETAGQLAVGGSASVVHLRELLH